MDRKTVVITLLTILLVASLSFNVYQATRPTTEVPTPADTLVYADDLSSITTFDPAECYSGANVLVAYHCYDTLVTYTGGDMVTPAPSLAESWDVSSDGLTWTFHLRRGVTFRSGNEFTAKDVEYSFDRVVELLESPSFMLTQLGITNESTRVIDDNTVQLTLGKKWARAIVEQTLSSWIACIVDSEVVSSHEVDGDRGNVYLDEHTEGTGGYVLTTWEVDAKVVLDINENHWKWSGETKIRDVPYIRKVIGLSVPEATSRMLMLEKGDVDIVTRMQPQQLELLKDDPEISYVPMIVPGYRVLCMMVLPEFRGEPNPLADNRVRQAIKYSIDYDGIINEIYMGEYAKPLQTMIPSSLPGHLPLRPYYRNITLGRQLLIEAGYPDGFTLNMIFRDSSDHRIIMEKLQSDLSAVGIEIQVDVLGSAELRARRNDRDFQLRISGFGLDYFDPDACAAAWGPTDSLGPDATIQLNAWREGWVNQTMAEWINEARSTLEWADRAPIYDRLTREILEYSPYAFLVELPYSNYAYRTWVEGFTPGEMRMMSYPMAENVYKET